MGWVGYPFLKRQDSSFWVVADFILLSERLPLFASPRAVRYICSSTTLLALYLHNPHWSSVATILAVSQYRSIDISVEHPFRKFRHLGSDQIVFYTNGWVPQMQHQDSPRANGDLSEPHVALQCREKHVGYRIKIIKGFKVMYSSVNVFVHGQLAKFWDDIFIAQSKQLCV